MWLSGALLGVTLLMLALSVGVWWYLRRQTGLPVGKVIYTDAGAWIPNSDPLYSDHLRLAGKPDYLVQQENGEIVPVEVKASNAPPEPYESHILQLAAYCMLVEENYGIRPFYGILQYRDRAFAIDYTEDLEEDLLDVLAAMRADLFEPEVDRSHDSRTRCLRCGVREQCYQRLA